MSCLLGRWRPAFPFSLSLFSLLMASDLSFTSYAHVQMQYLNPHPHTNQNLAPPIDDSLAQSQLGLSLTELGLVVQPAAHWRACFELEQSRANSSQLDLDQSSLSQGASELRWNDHALLGQTPWALSWSRAEVSYLFESSETVLAFGLIRVPEISAERLYYKPYLGSSATGRAVGGIFTDQGRLPGVALESGIGLFSYQIGLWQQTAVQGLNILPEENIAPVTGDDIAVDLAQFVQSYRTGRDQQAQPIAAESLLLPPLFKDHLSSLGAGFRVSLSQDYGDYASYAIGLGASLAPLNQPLVLNTITAYQDDFFGAEYSTIAFDKMARWGVDASVLLSNIQMNAGYQHQSIHKALGAFYPDNLNSAEATAFDRSGWTSSFWLETGFLMGPASYQLFKNYGAISGIKFYQPQAAFEVTARYGMSHHHNISALIEYTSYQDFNADNTGLGLTPLPLVQAYYEQQGAAQSVTVLTIDNTGALADAVRADKDNCYESKTTGWLLSVAWHINACFHLRAQYEYQSASYRKRHDDDLHVADWLPSLAAPKVSSIRFGGQYAF